MVVLNSHRVNCAALWALFGFSVFKPHFSNVFAATCNFNTYNGITVQEVYPVIVEVTLVLEVQNYITPVNKILFL